jgi:hypothetical protein
MHIGPVIVERDATRIRMTGRFQAEPILNLALLPEGNSAASDGKEGNRSRMGALRITQLGSPGRSNT